MFDISEETLVEITNGLEDDIRGLLQKALDMPKQAIVSSSVCHPIHLTFSVELKGGIVKFNVFGYSFSTVDKYDMLKRIKEHMHENYGLDLLNQRMYEYVTNLQFGNETELVDPMEIYALLKINQLI